MAERRKRVTLGRLIRWGVLSLSVLLIIRTLVLPIFGPMTSRAVVTGRVSRIVSPITGTVSRATRKGAVVQAGAPLAVVEDPRVDDGRLRELERRLGEISAAKPRLRDERAAVERVLERKKGELQKYRSFAMKQMQADLANSLLRAASAQITLAGASQRAEMSRALGIRGVASRHEFAEASRQVAIARHDADGLTHRLQPLRELTSDPEGPLASPAPELNARVDDLVLRAASLDAQIQEAKAMEALLMQDLERERSLIGKLRRATLTAPASGTVVGVERADGEYVRPGDTVLEVLDGRLHVEALFPGRYAALPKNSRAKVILANSMPLDGKVVLVSTYRPDPTRASPMQVEDPEGLVVYTVELEGTPDSAAVGMPVDVVITANESSWLTHLLILLRSIKL